MAYHLAIFGSSMKRSMSWLENLCSKHTHLQTSTSRHTDQSLQKSVLFSCPRKIVFKNFPPLKIKIRNRTTLDKQAL